MGAVSIEDIRITPLSRIKTAGGDVLHAMKNTDLGYEGCGEVYFSWIEKSAVKAWKRHKRMTMNLIVPLGSVHFVFLGADGQSVRQEIIGTDRYVRITVPPGIWFGFQGLSASQSLVLNVASIAHDPDEVQRVSSSDFDFNWNNI
jgi:dTDP-4-dehydrorhamnose 3,5-epimerase